MSLLILQRREERLRRRILECTELIKEGPSTPLLFHRVSLRILAVSEGGGGGGTSTLGERSTTDSCMLRSGRISRF
jgi:hypothetical protein